MYKLAIQRKYILDQMLPNPYLVIVFLTNVRYKNNAISPGQFVALA